MPLQDTRPQMYDGQGDALMEMEHEELADRITIMPDASITSASGASTETPTSTMTPPRTWTDPPRTVPIAGSTDTTAPSRMR